MRIFHKLIIYSMVFGFAAASAWIAYRSTTDPIAQGLFGGASASLLATLIFEIGRELIPWLIEAMGPRRRARLFFGLNLDEQAGKLKLVIQSEKITDIFSMEPYELSGLKSFLDDNPTGRMYKAREWVDRYDAAGARELLLCLKAYDQRTADIIPIGRDRTAGVQASSPKGLLIAMGLGFTEVTQPIVERVCTSWLRIERVDKFGDCLQISSEIIGASEFDDRCGVVLEAGEKDSDSIEWRRIVPKDWSLEQYITPKPNRSANDYAFILRYTETNELNIPQRVIFICAGFTEFGTYQAGAYLAMNWQALQKRSKTSCSKGPGFGDFFAVISGKSFSDGWSLVDRLFITPEMIAKIKSCEYSPWAKRFRLVDPPAA